MNSVQTASMDAAILFRLILRWCMVLAEVTFGVWVAALAIALLGWSAWGLSRLALRSWRALLEARHAGKSEPRHADH